MQVSSGFLISLFFFIFLSFILLPWPYTAQMANSMALLLISSQKGLITYYRYNPLKGLTFKLRPSKTEPWLLAKGN
jgi:hypothetical protein